MHDETQYSRAIAVTAPATLLVTLTFGVRTVLGMFIGPLNAATGVGFAAVVGKRGAVFRGLDVF